jgi:hypothetical protein
MPHRGSPSPRHRPRTSCSSPTHPSAHGCQSISEADMSACYERCRLTCNVAGEQGLLGISFFDLETILYVMYSFRCSSKSTNDVQRGGEKEGGTPSQGGVPRSPQRMQTPSTHVSSLPNPSVPKHAGPSSQHSEPKSVPQARTGRQIGFTSTWWMLGGGGRSINPASQALRPSGAARRP